MPDAASTRLTLPEGTFELRRYPSRKREPLQAWCGADLLLLEAARENVLPGTDLLVVNDEHGVLSTVLGPTALWTDSALAAMALSRNIRRNNRCPVSVVWSTGTPPGGAKRVLMRIPKNMAYFDYQLAALQALMAPGAELVCGGMDKHLSANTPGMIERYFGRVTRHRGSRRARLFSAVRGSEPEKALPVRPGYFCDLLGATLAGGANVFSSGSVDPGSRLLIEQFPRLAPARRVADLACGLGLIGLAALRGGIAETVLFADESAMALQASRDNVETLLGDQAPAQFHHGDGLTGVTGTFDLILCNPPFHSGHTVDDHVGRRLVAHALRHLRPGGRLCLVANRHLSYRKMLRQHFAATERLAANAKFTVWLARSGC